MIQIARTRSLDDLKEMLPHFTFNDESLREAMLKQIVDTMTNRPECLFVIKAVKDDKIIGFVVAQSGVGSSTWIAQAWAASEETWAVANEMFHRVILWTIGLGKESIQCQTARSSEAMYRRFGFVEQSKTMIHNIDSSVTQRLSEVFKEVVTNG